MKKGIVISILAIASVSLHAQFRMNSTGKVGIGYEPDSYTLRVGSTHFEESTKFDNNIGLCTAPSTTYRLDMLGSMRIQNSGSSNHVIFNHTGAYYQVAIYPANNNTCYLGKDGKAFAHIYAYNVHELNSDLRQKENIRDLDNALKIVLDLHPIKYDLKKEIAYDESLIEDPVEVEKLEKKRKDKLGFIGQEMINILPTAVEVGDSTGTYSIEYTRIIPVLIGAIQEQHQMILDLEDKIKDKDEKSAEEIVVEEDIANSLKQNNPNPFSENTYIEYSVKEDAMNAVLYIYDMNGTQLKSIPIHLKGNGVITINGGELQAGMYMYTLIVDERVIDTRQMILTK